MTFLSIQNLGKTFTDSKRTAGLRRLDLEIDRGELVSLLGPSGCGKTTTLRCIAGLETPDHGRIELDGALLFSERAPGARLVDVPSERRGLGMVFQDYALWPHMDVFRNVAFGLGGGRRSRSEIAAGVETALRGVRLWDQRDKRISQLSGGQQQRVALARALAPEPKVVLFDEPLSNLDAGLRDDLRTEILELQRRLLLTAIWVTHDQEEALGMSNRIVLMNAGEAEQIASPAEIWSAPATAFAAGFIGATNRLSGLVVQVEGQLALAVDDGPLLRLPVNAPVNVADRATAFIRTSAVTLEERATPAQNAVPIDILGQAFYGEHVVITARAGRAILRIKAASAVDAGRAWFARLGANDLMVYPEAITEDLRS